MEVETKRGVREELLSAVQTASAHYRSKTIVILVSQLCSKTAAHKGHHCVTESVSKCYILNVKLS